MTLLPQPLRVIVVIKLFIAIGFFAPNDGRCGELESAEAALLQTRLQAIIDYLDSSDYKSVVSLEEHLVLVYRLAAQRDPSPAEFFVLRRLCETIGLKRSAVLSIALRGTNLRPTWQQCRRFLERVAAGDFVAGSADRSLAGRLAADSQDGIPDLLQQEAAGLQLQSLQEEAVIAAETVAHRPYNTYFGYLHSHSELSDGKGSPEEAYAYARNQGDLDFFALSDHGEMLDLWPWEDEWDDLVEAAQNAYVPGSFATLWGFEWSSPIYGHVTVLNTNSHTDSVSEDSINDLYHWMLRRPEAFGHHNHPGEYDEFGEEFQHLKYFSEVIPQMVGIENWNGNSSFDKYYYSGSWSSDVYSYWDTGNRKGWYLGSLGSQDNHERNWGTMNPFRTAVLAENLTREDIIDAFRQRRFYATEDKNFHLDFRCQGYPMGSRLSGMRPVFEVSAFDGSGDAIRQVRLYRNGDLIEIQSVQGDAIRIHLRDRSFEGHSAYYYVIVQQTDDNDNNGRKDEAISSPIWLQDMPPQVPGMPWMPLLMDE